MFATELGAVRDQRSALASLVSGLDPDAVALCDAPQMWEHFDAMAKLAMAAKTLLARRVDESREAKRQGYRSTADFLAARGGTSLGSARDELATSDRVRALPATRAALGRGALSGPQASAIAGAASANPEAEQRLLTGAERLSLGELRDDCGRAKAAADPDGDAAHRRLHAERRLRRFTDAEGGWNLAARGTPEDGASLNVALDPIIDEIFHRARRNGTRESREAYAFDALIELGNRIRHRRSGAATGPRSDPASTDVAAGHPADRRGTPGSDRAEPAGGGGTVEHTAAMSVPEVPPDPGTGGSSPRRVDPTHLALLRIDLEALLRGAVEGEELCELTGVGPVPVTVARKLLGDSVLKLVITKGVDVANVTHLGRGPTVAQRIALLWSSPRCTVEGCPRTAVEIDHRKPWVETRHTRLDELDPLCDHDHDKKTYDGWALVAGTGRRPMVPPGDPRHPANAPPPLRGEPPDPPTEGHARLFDDTG